MKKKILLCLVLLLTFGSVNINAEEIQLTANEQIIKQIIASNYKYSAFGFFEAIDNGDLQIVNLFLKSGFDPNTTYLKIPAVYYAVTKKQPKIVDRLLAAGVNPNTNLKGKTLLDAAVASDNAETVKVLIKHGVNVNEQSWGVTPINCAVKKKNEEIVKLLLASGAKVDDETIQKALKLKNNEIKTLVRSAYKKQ